MKVNQNTANVVMHTGTVVVVW